MFICGTFYYVEFFFLHFSSIFSRHCRVLILFILMVCVLCPLKIFHVYIEFRADGYYLLEISAQCYSYDFELQKRRPWRKKMYRWQSISRVTFFFLSPIRIFFVTRILFCSFHFTRMETTKEEEDEKKNIVLTANTWCKGAPNEWRNKMRNENDLEAHEPMFN